MIPPQHQMSDRQGKGTVTTVTHHHIDRLAATEPDTVFPLIGDKKLKKE